MIKKENIVIPSEFNVYYDELNKVRDHFNLGRIDYQNKFAKQGTTIAVNDPKNVDDAMKDTKGTLANMSYTLPAYDNFVPGKGDIILAASDTTIKNILKGWQEACVNKSVCCVSHCCVGHDSSDHGSQQSTNKAGQEYYDGSYGGTKHTYHNENGCGANCGCQKLKPKT